ncbi:MAG: hypothetical protein AABW52_04315, partial [Nanoarchaeota archaeon]
MVSSNNDRSSGPNNRNPVSVALSPFGWLFTLLKWLFYIGILALVIFLVYGGLFRLTQSGEGSSQIKHATVAGEEPLSKFGAFIQGIPVAKDAYNFYFSPQSTSVSFESEVQSSSSKKLGVYISDFKDIKRVNNPGDDIEVTGTIKASSLEDEIKLKVFCSMEDYNNEELMPAEIIGAGADNEVSVFKNEETSINFNCLFPGGIQKDTMKTPKVTKFVKVAVTYEFGSRATQKVYFLPNNILTSLDRNNVDPFKQYSINDPLVNNREVKAVSTPGPLNLGVNVGRQPLTVNSNPYQLFVQLSSNPTFSGNLQKLDSIQLQVPDIQNVVSIAFQGENGFKGKASQCDFEYLGPGDNGFKLYQLTDAALARVNRDCNSKSLKDFAISESQCISLFKSTPLFGCKFSVLSVPES